MVVFDEDGTIVGEYYADLVIEGFIVVELKAVRAILNEHMAQIINYLKATRHELGLLINFGSRVLEFKRVVYSEEEPEENTQNSLS